MPSTPKATCCVAWLLAGDSTRRGGSRSRLPILELSAGSCSWGTSATAISTGSTPTASTATASCGSRACSMPPTAGRSRSMVCGPSPSVTARPPDRRTLSFSRLVRQARGDLAPGAGAVESVRPRRRFSSAAGRSRWEKGQAFRAKPRDRHEHAERDDDSQSPDAGGHEGHEVPPRLLEGFPNDARASVPHHRDGLVDGDREGAERRMRAEVAQSPFRALDLLTYSCQLLLDLEDVLQLACASSQQID